MRNNAAKVIIFFQTTTKYSLLYIRARTRARGSKNHYLRTIKGEALSLSLLSDDSLYWEQRFYIFVMIPFVVERKNFTIVSISGPEGTWSIIWLVASKTLVCPWNTKR